MQHVFWHTCAPPLPTPPRTAPRRGLPSTALPSSAGNAVYFGSDGQCTVSAKTKRLCQLKNRPLCNGCSYRWSGTAPACSGECNPGETYLFSDDWGERCSGMDGNHRQRQQRQGQRQSQWPQCRAHGQHAPPLSPLPASSAVCEPNSLLGTDWLCWLPGPARPCPARLAAGDGELCAYDGIKILCESCTTSLFDLTKCSDAYWVSCSN